MEIKTLIFEGNNDYKLLDSGNKCRLEEVNGIRIARPEPLAWWKCELPPEEWRKATVYFNDKETKEWKFKKEIPKELIIEINNLKSLIKFPKTSKQIGIFPEQSLQWGEIEEMIERRKDSRLNDEVGQVNILNLFGYTGMASLVAARQGMKVTHVDGSKAAIEWAKENQKLNNLESAPIRWILDDAKSFLKREIKREVKYDAIVMDPPTFGRGAKGQVWKIEEDLTETLDLCRQLLAENPLFFIINMYATELSPISLGNLLEDFTKDFSGQIEIGETVIKQKNSDRLLPTSIFAKWIN